MPYGKAKIEVRKTGSCSKLRRGGLNAKSFPGVIYAIDNKKNANLFLGKPVD
jgi:hypothetical protein